MINVENFRYIKKISISNEFSVESPVVIEITNVVLENIKNQTNQDFDFFGSIRSDAGDIRASLDAEGETEYPIDVRYNNTTNEITIFVRTLSQSFYLHWGSVSTTAMTSDSEFGAYACWADFVAVYHFSISNYRDFTGEFDGVVVGATLTTNGYEFENSGRIELDDAVGDALAEQHTINFEWLHDGTLSYGHFLDTRAGGNSGIDIQFANNELTAIYDDEDQVSLPGSTYTTENRVYNAYFVKSANEIQMVIDNVVKNVATFSGETPRSTTPIKIGNIVSNVDPLGAGRYLRSLRVRDYSITDEVISLEINNRINPATFFTETPVKDKSLTDKYYELTVAGVIKRQQINAVQKKLTIAGVLQ